MLLTRYGIGVWLPILIVMVVAAALFLWMRWWIPMAAVLLLGLALLSFFRDPIRRIKTDLPEGAMLSPADGTVSAVLDLEHHDITQGPAKLIRIFLSVLNVHINRSPCDGEVISTKRCPGQFLNAQTEESANVNECNIIMMRIQLGGEPETIGIRQVAGMIARTIVCPLQPGDRLQRGQKFGMIKFGSTTELILPRPRDVVVNVSNGDKVKGGVTVIASLKPPSSQTSHVVRPQLS